MSHARRVQSFGSVCFAQAYAKINLTLDVLGRRADGYHELMTVMQTVDLHDTLCLTATESDRVQVVCTRPELSNEDNLAARAAQLLRERFALKQGILIELRKRIPIAAGLGGGSSDAAAVLLAMRQWWELPLSLAELQEIAASLGSDVPFFLTGGLALCEGRGEQVTPLVWGYDEAGSYGRDKSGPYRHDEAGSYGRDKSSPYGPLSVRWVLLLKPAIGIATASVFQRLPASDYTDGSKSRAVITALQAGSLPQQGDFHNSLERSVLERYPQVAQAKSDLLQAGGSIVGLSGSGPTLYALFSELSCASQAQERLQAQGYETYLSHAVYPNEGNISVL